MAKDIKLNIKNVKIAEALKKFSNKAVEVPIKKPKKVKKKEEAEIDESKKRKARILPPKSTVEEVQESVQEEVLDTAQNEETKEEAPIVVEEIESSKPEVRSEVEVKEVILPDEDQTITVESEEKKKFKSYKDFKAAKKPESFKSFDTRDKLGLRGDEEERWRKKRAFKQKRQKIEIPIVRPTSLKIKTPISIKDLASEMKLKASELIQKLFLQGIIVTINDYLDDETTIQLLGHEFGCEITIDKSEEKRLKITQMSILNEIKNYGASELQIRAPVVTFMGHVDHGKTSLIDAIRSTNVTASEAGQITQHIGAFTTTTKFGKITILDTPGHAAFSEMRSRGANVTDIAIIVIAGDEGMKEQTLEAIRQAKEASVQIIVAINKSDQKGFDQEKVYRQLSDVELLPEAWGGTTITVNCSAKTKEGINELLEMIALQAEVLELRANPNTRARGTILESEMHKGFGAVATVLVQNGTLKLNDAIVFADKYGRIKTMHDQYDNLVDAAPPSTPVKITGLSNLASAGCEFVVVGSEKEARDLAEARKEQITLSNLKITKKINLENLTKKDKKIFNVIIRADVQGSLEALKTSLLSIHSDKIDLNIISFEVGEISESDISLAHASNAVILGFHTKIEMHAESLIKQLKVVIKLHNIIYHAIDDIKLLMKNSLDKLEEEVQIGKARVIETFKSSQLGIIAGCLITEGKASRNAFVKVFRNNEQVYKGKISSLKRVKEDVKEVNKGLECGIVIDGFQTIKIDDILEIFDINYLSQEL